jgi:hypothetical protein
MTEGDADRTDIDRVLQDLSHLSQEVLTEYEKLMTTYPHPTKMA